MSREASNGHGVIVSAGPANPEDMAIMVIPEWAGTRLLDSVCSEPYSALACPPSDLLKR
jgi:hypothetical protein